MMTFLGLIALLCISVIGYFSIRFRNNYKLIMVFGRKGCGKTTYLTKLSFKYMSQRRPVYTSEYIPGTFHIEPKDVGRYWFPPESVLLIDEVGMVYDNRKYKDFADEVRDYYKLQRHYKNTVYLFSQNFDIDVKLRNLTDYMVMLHNYFNCISVGKKIILRQTIIRATGMSEAAIKDDLVLMPFFFPGARVVTWIPKYHKYFNSFATPDLRRKDWKITPFPENVRPPRSLRKKRRRERSRLRSFTSLMPGALWAALSKRPVGQEPGRELPPAGAAQGPCGAETEGLLDASRRLEQPEDERRGDRHGPNT